MKSIKHQQRVVSLFLSIPDSYVIQPSDAGQGDEGNGNKSSALLGRAHTEGFQEKL